jgi:hypothetical protein
MAEPNFLLDDNIDDEVDKVVTPSNPSSKDSLANKELIEKLQGQKQILVNRIEVLDATIVLLRETPNYTRIHELLNTQV